MKPLLVADAAVKISAFRCILKTSPLIGRLPRRGYQDCTGVLCNIFMKSLRYFTIVCECVRLHSDLRFASCTGNSCYHYLTPAAKWATLERNPPTTRPNAVSGHTQLASQSIATILIKHIIISPHTGQSSHASLGTRHNLVPRLDKYDYRPRLVYLLTHVQLYYCICNANHGCSVILNS